MRILGCNFFGHDSAICLIDTSRREVVAESTERTTRVKHDDGDIAPALRACGIRNVDAVCHGYTSFNTHEGAVVAPLALTRYAIDRLAREHGLADPRAGLGKATRLAHLLACAPVPVLRYLRERACLAVRGSRAVGTGDVAAHIRRILREEGVTHGGVHFYDHHLCHAAAAYHFSPLAPGEQALVFTVDGMGDGHFSKLHLFHGKQRKRLGASRAQRFTGSDGPDHASVGLVYAHFLDALAYAGIDEEGSLTALAAYGKPDAALYDELRGALSVTGEALAFDVGRLRPLCDEAALTQRARRIGAENFAATVQTWLENVVVEHLEAARRTHGVDNLCLAGGVAANVAMNLRIFERAGFRQIYVFPAMGDEGISAGAAVLRALDEDEDVGWLPSLGMPYFGHRVSQEEVKAALCEHPELATEDLGEAWPERAARAVAEDRVIGVVHGHMEFGPRALGNRSILASPASVATRDRINASIKHRPALQPCCPSILEEERERLFEASLPHKHMTIAFRMRPPFRQLLPGAVHADGTARTQFVAREDNPEFHALLSHLKRLTGFGVAINTSFNLHGRAIVRTAAHALRDFLDCRLDELYLEGHRVVRRT